MKQTLFSRRLDLLAEPGASAFSTRMLRSYFPGESEIAFKKSLERMVKSGILERVCRGAYIYVREFRRQAYKLEEIARVLRAGEYSYISQESALSEYGIISQMPLKHLTLMTTGRSQTFKTPYGTIEFTHTERVETDILENVAQLPERPLRIASPELALADLQRAKRNTQMVDRAVYEEITGEKNRPL